MKTITPKELCEAVCYGELGELRFDTFTCTYDGESVKVEGASPELQELVDGLYKAVHEVSVKLHEEFGEL